MATRERSTAILDVRPMLRGSEKAVVEAVLGRRPGVERVEANPVAQTATVVYDPARTSLADLRRWVEECGLHCAGQSVPEHIGSSPPWTPPRRAASSLLGRSQPVQDPQLLQLPAGHNRGRRRGRRKRPMDSG